ncbi:Ig-like domain-containing protein [Aliiroseovarius sp. N1Y82]|nr:Ig-like domain-containing protein [Aliiroseovarius subalbicans]
MTFVNIENVILPPNNGPDANDDSATTDEDTAVTIDVLGNDTDPDFDDLTVTEATAPNGTVTINPDGTLTYEPDPDFNGEDTITYTVDDGNGGTDTATVTVTVTPVNDDPVAEDDTATVEEDGSVDIPVLDNDSDVDGDDLTVTEATAPNGTVTINPDGTLTYEPDPDFNGEDTITYTVDDGNGGTDTATVTVTVTPVNDGPTAEDDTDETDEDSIVSGEVLGNDSDPEGDALSVSEVNGAPANVGSPVEGDGGGSFTLNSDGTYDFDPDGDFEELQVGESATTSVSYTIDDGNGGSDAATLTITVTGVNDDPVAEDDYGTTPYNTAVIVDVLGNDTDVEDDILSVLGTPTSADGTVVVNPDGTLTFTPTDGFEGVAEIEYTVTDGNGGTDTGTAFITVEENPLDGIVEGTAGDDLIDLAYTGDPEGDMVDALDEILPGEGPNDDIIEAYGGDDTIYAGVGNDEIDGGAGDDTIFGEDGNDEIVDEQGSDFVDGGAGDDVIDVAGGDSPDTIAELLALGNPNGLADLDYSPYSEVIPVDATPNDDLDTVYGGDGNDTIKTGDDKDFIDGGAGNDTIYAGIDDDTVYGGTGDDYIEDVQGADTIYGGDGNDTIIAGFDTISDYIGDDPNVPNPAYPFPNDQNQIDGMDYVDGGAGDDIIQTGDDRDTILGGTGNDTIDAGIDDDTVDGGEGDDYIEGGHGSDNIDGGAGNDVIWGGEGPGTDPLNIIDAIDPVPNNGIDTIHGGDGNDIIYGQDDDDILYGDAGQDFIDGGIDDDEIHGGDAADTLLGGQGNDVIFGDDGRDIIDGGEGDDVVDGGRGSDQIYGGAGDDVLDGGTGGDFIDGGEGDDTVIGTTGRDTLLGGAGDDTITAGLGLDVIDGGDGDDTIDAGGDDDVVEGGAGNDTITGGAGIDTLSGGDDRDTFHDVNGGDTVDGGAGGDDWDVLDLTGSAPQGGSLHVTITGPDSNGNGSDGFVTYYDSNGAVTGTLDFTEIEEIVPCFTPGTKIATPKGERLVEELQEGDRIITRDNGIQEIRWVGHKSMDWRALEANQHLKPVLIQAGSLGNGLPERDMLVSPNHRVLVANDRTALYFEEREVLVSAKHLVDNKGVHRVDTMGTTYVHFMFDHHEVVLSDGAWTESFQPGDYSLKGIGNAQRTEIFEMFPELETAEGIEDYTAARRTLKAFEAKMLLT